MNHILTKNGSEILKCSDFLSFWGLRVFVAIKAYSSLCVVPCCCFLCFIFIFMSCEKFSKGMKIAKLLHIWVLLLAFTDCVAAAAYVVDGYCFLFPVFTLWLLTRWSSIFVRDVTNFSGFFWGCFWVLTDFLSHNFKNSSLNCQIFQPYPHKCLKIIQESVKIEINTLRYLTRTILKIAPQKYFSQAAIDEFI